MENKRERGEVAPAIVLVLTFVGTTLLLAGVFWEDLTRGAYRQDLKKYFGLQHSESSRYSSDEAALLCPMVRAKLAELDALQADAKTRLAKVTPETSQELLTIYQKARDDYRAAQLAAKAYGLACQEVQEPR